MEVKKMGSKTIPDYPRGITFEQVWAALMEDRERIKKMEEAADRRQAQWQKEAAERQAKLDSEAAERKKEADQRHEQMQKEAAERQAKLDSEAAQWQKEAAERQAKWDSEAAERKKEADQRHEQMQKEAAERHAKWEKEAAQRQKDAEQRQKEAEQRQKEFDQWHKETERIVRRNSKQMGDLHRRFGELAEHLVAPGIVRRFNEMGYKFEFIVDGNYRILDNQGNIRTEIDLILENGACIIAVEVKSKPVIKDVEHHVRRLEILREYRDKYQDKRKIQGAIAGAIFGTEEKKATLEAGLFVIEQSGDTMKIDVPEGFKPREW